LISIEVTGKVLVTVTSSVSDRAAEKLMVAEDPDRGSNARPTSKAATR
jgi:hypothetical protein